MYMFFEPADSRFQDCYPNSKTFTECTFSIAMKQVDMATLTSSVDPGFQSEKDLDQRKNFGGVSTMHIGLQ